MTDHDIDELYKSHAKEQPPTEVDNAITALAQQSVQSSKKSKIKSHRRYLPYSVAASVMLVGILVLNFPQHYLSPPAQPSIDPLLNDQLNEQEILQLAPENQPQVSSERPLMKMKATKELSKQRVSQKKAEQSPQRLIRRIEEQIALKNTKRANQLTQQFIEQYGLAELPEKYHYLIEKTD